MLRDYGVKPWELGGPPEFFPSEVGAIERQSDADSKASQKVAAARSSSSSRVGGRAMR